MRKAVQYYSNPLAEQRQRTGAAESVVGSLWNRFAVRTTKLAPMAAAVVVIAKWRAVRRCSESL